MSRVAILSGSNSSIPLLNHLLKSNPKNKISIHLKNKLICDKIYKKYGVMTYLNNDIALKNKDYIFLNAPYPEIRDICNDIKPLINEKQIIISNSLNIKVSHLKNWLHYNQNILKMTISDLPCLNHNAIYIPEGINKDVRCKIIENFDVYDEKTIKKNISIVSKILYKNVFDSEEYDNIYSSKMKPLYKEKNNDYPSKMRLLYNEKDIDNLMFINDHAVKYIFEFINEISASNNFDINNFVKYYFNTNMSEEQLMNKFYYNKYLNTNYFKDKLSPKEILKTMNMYHLNQSNDLDDI
jgi:hypothetical protein